MTDLKRRSLMATLGAVPLAVPLLTQAQTLESTPKFKQISSRERIRQRYFPNLILTTHEGRKVKFYDDLVKDKIVITATGKNRIFGKTKTTMKSRELRRLIPDLPNTRHRRNHQVDQS